MKEGEIRKAAICANCSKPFGHTNLPLFWRITLERFHVDLQAMVAQDGLGAMLGGSAVLANIMGPDRDMAKPLMDPIKVTICENCITEPIIIASMAGD